MDSAVSEEVKQENAGSAEKPSNPPPETATSPTPPKPKKKPGRRPGKTAVAARPKEPPLDEKKLLLEWYPQLFLGEKTYKWQFDVLQALGFKESRVALKAANGSGKTSRVVAAAILWHLMRFPGSKTVVTAGVYRQVVDALWPTLKAKSEKLGGREYGWEVTESHIRYTARGFETAMCVGFSAADANKAEGWHRSGPSQNLLYIIDEAKGVSDQIFHAMERCQPSRVLVVSSPGGCAGAFYDIFRTGDPRYDLFSVTAYDCPHLKREDIDQQIAIYGLKSPIIQSMIFAEFGDESENSLILPPMVLQRALSSPPEKKGKELVAGCDFAAGGDENVIQVREGNAVKETIKWREKDTMAAVGRFVTEFKRLGLEPSNIWGDGGGLGLPMCDALREAGWPINRVNNGEAARDDDKFANRGTEMWVKFARMVETGKVVLPREDEMLHRQLTTRRLEHNSKGKLLAEPKDKMAKRGLESPDRADALVLAFAAAGTSFDDYMKECGGKISFDKLDEELDMVGGDYPIGCHAG